MNPLTRRRWQQFKHNRRGYWSLWIFMVLFTCSLGAEFIANDRPILMKHAGQIWIPALFDYTELELGGELPISPQYRDPYVIDLVEKSGGWILMPPIPYRFDTQDLYIETSSPAQPSAQHWLGTDDRAKDTLARVIYGFRLSVLFGLSLTLLSSLIGISVGALQGYGGGIGDRAGQLCVEIGA